MQSCSPALVSRAKASTSAATLYRLLSDARQGLQADTGPWRLPADSPARPLYGPSQGGNPKGRGGPPTDQRRQGGDPFRSSPPRPSAISQLEIPYTLGSSDAGYRSR
jgi:hypothetical protein